MRAIIAALIAVSLITVSAAADSRSKGAQAKVGYKHGLMKKK